MLSSFVKSSSYLLIPMNLGSSNWSARKARKQVMSKIVVKVKNSFQLILLNLRLGNSRLVAVLLVIMLVRVSIFRRRHSHAFAIQTLQAYSAKPKSTDQTTKFQPLMVVLTSSWNPWKHIINLHSKLSLSPTKKTGCCFTTNRKLMVQEILFLSLLLMASLSLNIIWEMELCQYDLLIKSSRGYFIELSLNDSIETEFSNWMMEKRLLAKLLDR